MRFFYSFLFICFFFSAAGSYTPTLPATVNSNQLVTSKKSQPHHSFKKFLGYLRKASEVDNDLAFLILLAVILPFFAVFLKEGGATTSRFWISLLLTALFWLPGVIYSLLVVLNKVK